MTDPVPSDYTAADWNIAVADVPERQLVTYTCPYCHTDWSVNVEPGETTTVLYCHLDGNSIEIDLTTL